MSKIKFPQTLISGVLVIVAMMTTILAAFFYDDVIKALTLQEEPFTELYFENHLQLPKVITLASPIKTSFTIHNLEHKVVVYPIRISTQDESVPPKVTEIMKTEATLEHDQSKTIPFEFTISEFSTPRQKVTVELENLNQTIHFWAVIATPSATPNPTPTP